MDMVAKARKKLGLEDPLPAELLQGDHPNPTELKVQVTQQQKGNSGILSGRPNPSSTSSIAVPSPAFFRPNIPLPPIAYRNADMLPEKKVSAKSSTKKIPSKSSKKSKKNINKDDVEEDFILKPSIPVGVSISSANYKQQSKKERYAKDHDENDDDDDVDGKNDNLRAGGRNINVVFESEYEKKLQADYEQLKSEFNEKLTKAHSLSNTNTITNGAVDRTQDSPSLSVNSVVSSDSPSTSQLPSVERRGDALVIDTTDKEDVEVKESNGGIAAER